MEQIIFHLTGDYITQNHWMAVNKVKFNSKGWLACFIHCTLYTFPFIFICSWLAVFVIFTTHFIIDKFRLAKYIIMLRDWNWNGKELQPPFLSVWLLIIADNTLHVTINHFSIKYL